MTFVTQLFHTHFSAWLLRCCYKLIFVPRDSTSLCAERLSAVEMIEIPKRVKLGLRTSEEAFVDAALTQLASLV